LKKFAVFREEIKMDLDNFDYILYTYGLNHYKDMPLLEPLEYKDTYKIYEFVIVIDTSGSVWRTDVQRFLNKTYGIIKSNESFHKKMKLHIIQADNKVQDDIVIHSQSEFDEYIDHFVVKGSGGTDFRPAFEYIDNLIEKKEFSNLRGIIYFTDGYGTFPQKRPKYEVAFVFLDDSYTDISVPSWAIKFVLDTEEL
jgi:predicted metal-dependent peptidase